MQLAEDDAIVSEDVVTQLIVDPNGKKNTSSHLQIRARQG